MKSLTLTDLKTLAKQHGDRCISLFIPTHPAGSNTAEDQLRLRNLLRLADAQLVEEGWRVPDAAALLAPGRALLDDEVFWRELDRGLAVFLSGGESHHFRVPIHFGEKLAIASRYHIKPLLPLLNQQVVFYVLALSQNRARLFRCTRFDWEEVTLERAPHGVAEIAQYDSWQKEVRVRSGAPAGTGRWSAIYFGSGGEADTHRDELAHYCHQVDQALRGAINDDHAMLVLAGVSPLVALYREVSQYARLADHAIRGNPEHLSPAELQAEGYAILKPHFQQRQAEAVETFRRLANSKRASHDLLKVVRAAHSGRVQTLFLAIDREEPGIYDPESQAIYLSSGTRASGDDLLNLAAAQSLLNGGEVYALPSNEMPTAEPLAAVLRY